MGLRKVEVKVEETVKKGGVGDQEDEQERNQKMQKVANIPVAPFRTKNATTTGSPTIFIDATHRQYANPISYLGGPQLTPRNRYSIESILSLD